MRPTPLLLAALAVSAALPAAAQPADPYLARANRLLTQSPVVDGHNDLPWAVREDSAAPMDVRAYDLRTHTRGMTDLARLKAGHVGGQFWSVYIPGERDDPNYAPRGASASTPGYARVQLEQIDIAR
ncbi:MAG TPA: membrane dipeptidase, partial [Gemmatimonadaceae bacterium]|nr:membrane dipeptidase [Gemmatimonadaceae bacterium]